MKILDLLPGFDRRGLSPQKPNGQRPIGEAQTAVTQDFRLVEDERESRRALPMEKTEALETAPTIKPTQGAGGRIECGQETVNVVLAAVVHDSPQRRLETSEFTAMQRPGDSVHPLAVILPEYRL